MVIIKAETVSGDEYYAMVEQRDRMREQAQTSRTAAQERDGLLKQVAAVLNQRPVSRYDLEEMRLTLTCAGYDCLAGCDQEDEVKLIVHARWDNADLVVDGVRHVSVHRKLVGCHFDEIELDMRTLTPLLRHDFTLQDMIDTYSVRRRTADAAIVLRWKDYT